MCQMGMFDAQKNSLDILRSIFADVDETLLGRYLVYLQINLKKSSSIELGDIGVASESMVPLLTTCPLVKFSLKAMI